MKHSLVLAWESQNTPEAVRERIRGDRVYIQRAINRLVRDLLDRWGQEATLTIDGEVVKP